MSMDPQEATEHDYPHDDEDCNACGGSEQIEIVFQDHNRDYIACPVCLARDKNAEIERLNALLETAGGQYLDKNAECRRMRAAITGYLSAFDRCGGSEAVSAEEFAAARQALRDAVQSPPEKP